MDTEQQKRFRRAVDDKSAEAQARSEATGPGGDAADPGAPTGSQAEREDTAHMQDDFSIRDKNSRHKKVTADKWNQ